MPCPCKKGKCTTCACAKAKKHCTAACHGGATNELCMCWDGACFTPNPFELKPPHLRKALAQAGQSPMGDKDELIRRLRDHMVSQGQGSSGGAGGGGGTSASSSSGGGGGGSSASSSGGGGGGGGAKAVIARVNELAGDYGAILSLSGSAITAASPTAAMRKAYLKLSLKIHPDKNGGTADAKQAFQHLVSAYERLSQPELYLEEEAAAQTKGKKQKKIARSNHGCHVTKCSCPRCHMEWGKAELGLEDGAYNWFMMAVKEYSCGRCLLNFGCMTAEHRCPHCRKPFEYDPNDYHRAIECGNEKCQRKFGFWMFHVSERRELEIRREVKAQQEARLKEQEQKGGRAARAAGRRAMAAPPPPPKGRGKAAAAGGAAASSALTEEEKAFVLGLLDECPRCGKSALACCGGGFSEGAATAHLRRCTDAAKHAKHAQRKAAAAARAAAVEGSRNAQDDMMALKQWEFQGSQAGQLWMLGTRALIQQCELRGVSGWEAAGDDKAALIALLAPLLRRGERGRLLTDGTDTGDAGGGGGSVGASLAAAEEDDLPSNLWSMSAGQLLAVAASYGVKCSPTAVKADIINALEKARYKGTTMLLLGAADDQDEDTEQQQQQQQKKKKKRAHTLAQISDSSSDSDVPLASLVQRKKAKAVIVLSSDSESD